MFAQLLHGLGFTVGDTLNFQSLVIDPLVSGHAFGWDAPLWFVAPLFFAEMFDFGLRLLLRVRNRKGRELVLIVAYLALGCAAVFYGGTSGCGPGVELAVGRTALFLSYYAFGRLYRVFLEQHDTLNSLAYFGISLAVQVLLVLLCGERPSATPCWLKFSSNPVLMMALAANGIALWLRISRHLAPFFEKSLFLQFAADSTFSIMAHQVLGFFALNAVFFGMSCLGMFSGFALDGFLADCYYRAVPSFLDSNGAKAFSTLYVAAGFAVPLAIHFLWVKIKGFVR